MLRKTDAFSDLIFHFIGFFDFPVLKSILTCPDFEKRVFIINRLTDSTYPLIKGGMTGIPTEDTPGGMLDNIIYDDYGN
jgi:hypothetical protein